VSQRGEIGLGDLIRVVDRLAPDDVALARRLARILQVGEAGAAGEADAADAVYEVYVADADRSQDEPVTAPRPAARSAPVRNSAAQQQALAPGAPSVDRFVDRLNIDRRRVHVHWDVELLAPDGHAANHEHTWVQRPRRADSLPAYDVARTLPAPGSVSAAPKAPLSPALSLFQPRWTRSLLTAALATEQADGDVDLGRLIDALARRVALRGLPRRPRRTMRLGAQVLIERGDAMLPFRRDVAQILQRIHALCGEVTALSFRGDPDRVYRQSPRNVMAHVAPPVGTPVVALGDLGVGDPIVTTAGRWLAWAQRLHHRDCPVVIITPIARGDWPAALLRVATIIPWDRATTSSAVHRARAGRRPG
jgi:hypothetical protein